MPCSRSDLRLGVTAVALLSALQLPNQVLAHAKELGCKGTHQNNGLWMLCGGGAMLHKELSQE